MDNTKNTLGIIKVCPNPNCQAVYHNIPKKITRCNDCGANVMKINEDTFWKKFALNFYQYNFTTMEFYRPILFKHLKTK